MLKEQIDADVEERLIELDAEGEAFNRECWDALKTVCESRPGFDWKNYNNEMTAQEAADFLSEEFRELDALLTRLEALLS